MRRLISRFLLVALAVVAGVAVWRLAAGGRGGAVVALDGIRAETLRHEAFALSGTARLAIDAVGSFEERPDTALAALGWIVRRSNGAVVWKQRPGAHPERGLVSATRDTLELPAGTYDAYFASYGDPLLRAAAAPTRSSDPSVGQRIREALSQGGRAWQGEAGRWHLVVHGATPADRALAEALGDDDPADADAGPDLVWTTHALGSDDRDDVLLRVSSSVEVTLEATLEATGGVVADSAALVRLGAVPDTVWAFSEAGSVWAGGSVKNRRARATVRLEPGLYRASARTDGTHAAYDWTANPPFAPWTWGLTVRRRGADAGAIAVLDADALDESVRRGTSDLPVIAEMRCVGSDQTREVAFALAAPVEALVVAQGEISGDNAYDFATLLQGGREVWRQTWENSDSAGGRSSNQRAAVQLSLSPGDYVLRFETDDSHDCEDDYVGGDAPDDEAFWGAALVALDPAFDASSVRRAEAVAPVAEAVPDAEPGRALVQFERVGNDARLSSSFTLDDKVLLRIVAVGELLTDERLDYGWIEDEDGEVVWEMTRRNTTSAGGAAKNRRFDGTVTLGPGRFVAHYVTNGRHAFDDFEGGASVGADTWGLRVVRIGSGEVRL